MGINNKKTTSPSPIQSPRAPAQVAPQPTPRAPHDELTFNTTPNYLSLLRIAFVPWVIGLLFIEKPTWDIVAAFTFTAASITDWFDGYIARTRQVITVYGKLLDPLADKFLVVSSLIMLQELHRIPAIVVMLLVCRELAITGLRALASAEGVIISASDSAKWKTGTQMVAIPCLMAQSAFFNIPFGRIGIILLYLSLGISLWSANDYVLGFFRGVQEKRKQRSQNRKVAREARKAARAARLASRKEHDRNSTD